MTIIIYFLGPTYLPHTISILKAQLQRGYQLHILVYTTHAILSAVISKCDPNEAIDVVVHPILEMVNNELFANLMEEKKVAALGTISHKKSLITIFGHKHKILNFIKIDHFHEKNSMGFYFGSYLESNF